MFCSSAISSFTYIYNITEQPPTTNACPSSLPYTDYLSFLSSPFSGFFHPQICCYRVKLMNYDLHPLLLHCQCTSNSLHHPIFTHSNVGYVPLFFLAHQSSHHFKSGVFNHWSRSVGGHQYLFLLADPEVEDVYEVSPRNDPSR
jgi:hypothetical protein